MKARYATVSVSLAAVAITPSAYGFEGTRVLPIPSKLEPAELHLAINPTDPNNLIAASNYDNTKAAMEKGVYAWSSHDGGSTWSGRKFIGRRFLGKISYSFDPVAQFGPTGTAYVTAGGALYGRTSWQAYIAVGNSSNGGSSYSSFVYPTKTTNSGPVPMYGMFEYVYGWNDKEWLVADTSGGPHSGNIYAAWNRIEKDGGRLVFSRSTDGGSTFSTPVKIQRESSDVQIAVRPNGTVDLVWTSWASPDGIMRMRHASSTDGGATFSKARTIAAVGKGLQSPDPLPSLAVNSSGVLLACWARLPHIVTVARTKCSRSTDGTTWSAPTLLPGSAAISQTLPALAAQGTRFWLLSYQSGFSSTKVVLYRSDGGGASFTKFKTLATRSYGKLGMTFVGDYMGLVASADHVIASYVLAPTASDPRQRAYVTSVSAP